MIPCEYRALPERGLDRETCEKWGYGVGRVDSRICHVANYPDGSQKLRFEDKTFRWLGNNGGNLYGQWLWKPGGKYVTVCEGELDALTVSMCQGNKWPVVSLPNGASGAASAVREGLEYLESFENVRLSFDMDEPGRKAAESVAQLLTPGKASIVHLPLKDANEMLKAERVDELIQALWESQPYRPDGILQGEDIWQTAEAMGSSHGVPYPYPGLNELTLGIRLGEVIVITAGTGQGKSTFCKEVAHHLMSLGKRVGYVALEETPRRSLLGLLSCEVSRPLHLQEEDPFGDPEIRKAWERMEDRLILYNHIGVQDERGLFAKMAFMAKGCGAEYIIFDHLAMLQAGAAAGDNERKAIDRTMLRLVSLAQEAKCALLVVSHLRNPEGKAHEEGGRVTANQLRGSGGIKQMAFDVIGLERDQQGEDSDVSTMRVLKCRNGKATGVACRLRYDHDTGRLLQENLDFECVGSSF